MNVQRLFYKTKYLLNKNSPEILLVGGITGIILSTVLACKATLKVDEVVKDSEDTMKKIIAGKHGKNPVYKNEEEYKRDVTIATVQRAVSIGKLYLPSVVVGGVSVAMLVGGHRISSKRYLAVAGAYTALDQTFKQYRARVVETEGVEKDSYYFHGKPQAMTKVTSLDDEGNEVEVEVPESSVNVDLPSSYVSEFDSLNQNFSTNHDTNMFFLMVQQRFVNEMLKIRGHMFLNEVYDRLGLPRTDIGALVGWVWHEDKLIDFGLDNPVNMFTRNFRDGELSKSITLTFNVEGIIFNLL